MPEFWRLKMRLIALFALCLALFAPLLGKSEEFFVDVEEASIYCQKIGEGAPLFILHGGPGLSQGYLFEELSPLAEDRTCLFFDQRYCGNSTGELQMEFLTPERFVDDIESLRKALGFEKISLFGHSWGGYLAMRYAIAYPENVNTLILANSIPSCSNGMMLFMDEWFSRMAPIMDQFNAMSKNEELQSGNVDLHEELMRLAFEAYCYLPKSAHLLHLRMTPQAVINEQIIRDHLGAVLRTEYDLKPELSKFNIPTLILHGDTDIVPAETAKTTHEALIDSTLVILDRCGHFPFVEQPEAFLEEIRSFLSQSEISE